MVFQFICPFIFLYTIPQNLHYFAAFKDGTGLKQSAPIKMQGYLWDILRGKGKEEHGDFTEAHMGEENNFYYNKELKRWVVRGEEDKAAGPTNATHPPPKNSICDVPPLLNVSGSHVGRGPLTSAKLYTQIPGIEVMESIIVREKDSLLPPAAKSQFVPESSWNNNDYDFVN